MALGIIVATVVTYRAAKQRGLPAHQVWDVAFWVVVAAFIGARLGYVVLYEPAYFWEHPGEAWQFWLGGFSSFGGFFGGAVAGWLVIKKYKLNFWKWIDVILLGLPIGWAIGRIGCFFIHDHPGRLTDFFLGVQYPDGGRHDLGLYEAINAGILALVLFLFREVLKKRPGAVAGLVSLWYGLTRFFLDFLRAVDGATVDIRYFGLTPGQYGSAMLVVFGVWLLIFRRASDMSSRTSFKK